MKCTLVLAFLLAIVALNEAANNREITINVFTISHGVRHIKVMQRERISNVKARVEQAVGSLVNTFSLLSNGALLDEKKTLSDYEIQDGDTLHQVRVKSDA
ncbi:hypothetical protein HDE_13417 [Halotydeus destructor]|nr:hypothetical protein HDE_13417 [Halotydeus destructor]